MRGFPFAELRHRGESRVRGGGTAQVAKSAAFLLQDYLSHLPLRETFCDLAQNLSEQRCSISTAGKWSPSGSISPAGRASFAFQSLLCS